MISDIIFMIRTIDTDLLITVFAAVCSAVLFVMIVSPYMNRVEQKERYNKVIKQKRKELYEVSVQKNKNRNASARDTMVMFFKVQQLVGDLSQKMRGKLVQAGIRDPSAPLKYALARLFLIIIMGGIGLYITSTTYANAGQFIKFVIIIGLCGFGYALPGMWLKNITTKRRQEINASFPDSLDLLLICVQGGMGLNQALDRVAEEVSEFSPILAEELGVLSAEMSLLNDRKEAFREFAFRAGVGSARNFAMSLIQAEQYGTSISSALDVIADELRDIRMQEAERKAATLPSKLSLPMMVFVFPVLLIVIMAPMAIRAMSVAG